MKQKEQKEFTIEELQENFKKNQETLQERFMEKILNDISYLNEKANSKDYIPTEKEREMFRNIVIIVKNMNEWF